MKSSSGFLLQKHGESQFMFSEMNKKLMADEGLNLSGISDKNLPPKIDKNNIKNGVFLLTDIKNNNYKSKYIKKITEDFEEDKNPNKGNEKKENNIPIPLPTLIPINSDKESLISILSDLM